MKKTVSLLLAVCAVLMSFLFSAPTVNAVADPTVNHLASAYLYNIENKKAVFSYNPDEEVYPTSTVKIMTGIVALEALSDRLEEKVTVTADMLSNVVGNNIDLKIGETVKIGDMLGALLVNGANDAAYVLAYTACASVSEFVLRMNSKAAEIGAGKTVFTNPTGMHDANMHTTARDICTIALYAYNLKGFMEYAELLKYTIEATNVSKARTLYNRNCLLSLYYEKSYYYDKARGMNAGSTSEGGYCVVTTASDGDLTYLCVVMDAETDENNNICSYTNAKAMLDWAFSSYGYVDVLSPDQTVCELPVTLSMGVDYVTLVSKDTLSIYLPTDTDIDKEIKISWTTDSQELQSPIKKGEVVGRVTALYGDEPLGTADLITTADIERSDMLYTLYKIKEFSKSSFFIATLVSAAIISVLYLIIKSIYLKNSNKHKYR